ncbi:MAG: hypothetical protein ABIO92_06200 [Chloroflexia bacterium]
MDDDIFMKRFTNWQARLAEEIDSYNISDPSIYDDLCLLYLDANSKQRQQLPVMVAPPESSEGEYRLAYLTYEYMRWVSQRIRTPEDVQVLRLGLAAAAIVEESIDFRDALVSLAFLHHAATEAGINPKPYFKEVADMARPETRGFIRGFLARSKREIKGLIDLFPPVESDNIDA